MPSPRLAVLVSGRGSNLAALLGAQGERGYCITEVISSRADAPACEIARQAGLPCHVLDSAAFTSRAAHDVALAELLEDLEPQLIALAGYMRILPDALVERWAGRMLNIHPSLLPALPGLNTHQRAIAEGHREHGASVHFVTPKVDTGPVIMQARTQVAADESVEDLAARVLALEHQIYPRAIELVASGSVQWRGGTVFHEGEPLRSPLQLESGF